MPTMRKERSFIQFALWFTGQFLIRFVVFFFLMAALVGGVLYGLLLFNISLLLAPLWWVASVIVCAAVAGTASILTLEAKV